MGGLTTEAAPTLNVYQLESGLPSTWTWNAGVQYMLPKETALDFSYTGQHSYNLVEDVNINAIDFGALSFRRTRTRPSRARFPAGRP